MTKVDATIVLTRTPDGRAPTVRALDHAPVTIKGPPIGELHACRVIGHDIGRPNVLADSIVRDITPAQTAPSGDPKRPFAPRRACGDDFEGRGRIDEPIQA
jgi:hypothetical protein